MIKCQTAERIPSKKFFVSEFPKSLALSHFKGGPVKNTLYETFSLAAVGGSERELRRATPDSQGSQGDSSDGRQNSQAKSEDDKEKREAWGRYCWML